MKVYFSNIRISELQQYCQMIAPLFSSKEYDEMVSFLADINKGYCDIERYNNIYSILNIVSKRNKEEKTEGQQRKTQVYKKFDEEISDKREQLRVLELIRLQIATRYYVQPLSKENKNELDSQLKYN